MVAWYKRKNKERGYIALISVLVIGTAATAIAVTLLTVGLDSQRSATIVQQSKQARALAIACGQEASQQIHDNIAFSGTNSLSLGQGGCTYTVANTAPKTRTITATGTVGNVVKKVYASATIGTAAITLSSWREGAAAIPGGSPATPAFVQIKMNASQSSVSTIGATMDAQQAAGNTNVVIIGWDSATGTISSVGDTASNTYVLIGSITRGTALSQAVYYAKNITAGQPNVTVTFGAAVASPDLRIIEYSGLDTTAPLDASVAATGSGTTASSGTLNTNFGTDLIVGAGQTAGAFSGAGASYTARGISANGNIGEDRVVVTAGAYTATAPTSSAAWIFQAVGFKAAGQ